jgi:hypothetical protein
MPNVTEAQIKSRIAEFIQELDLLVRRSSLDALRGILEGRAAPVRRGSGRPRGSGRGGNVDDAATKILAYVRSNDGQGIGAISDATGIDLKTAKKAAIKLLAEGALKKSGQKRGTVYHVGSGRKPRALTRKAGKRRGRKAKRVARKATKAKRKPGRKRRAAPRRKVRAAKKVVVIPVRRSPAPAPKAVMPETDVPEALAAV